MNHIIVRELEISDYKGQEYLITSLRQPSFPALIASRLLSHPVVCALTCEELCSCGCKIHTRNRIPTSAVSIESGFSDKLLRSHDEVRAKPPAIARRIGQGELVLVETSYRLVLWAEVLVRADEQWKVAMPIDVEARIDLGRQRRHAEAGQGRVEHVAVALGHARGTQ
jgi:hypothetical protein